MAKPREKITVEKYDHSDEYQAQGGWPSPLKNHSNPYRIYGKKNEPKFVYITASSVISIKATNIHMNVLSLH